MFNIHFVSNLFYFFHLSVESSSLAPLMPAAKAATGAPQLRAGVQVQGRNVDLFLNSTSTGYELKGTA
jgi:hypothetical protein